MKKTIVTIGLLWFVVNGLFGLLLSAYAWTNVAVSSVVIAATAALLLWVNGKVLCDAFKVSLSILFALAGVVEYGIACLMPARLQDNWGSIALLLLLTLQVALVVVTRVVSNKVK